MADRDVLMIHGAGGGGFEWAIWRRVFEARGCRVRAPDLMPATAGLAATGYGDYVAQLSAVTETLNSPVLIGASLGGLLAIDMSHRHECSALVLINPMPPAAVPAAALRQRQHEAIVAWSTTASLAGTARALPDADAATWHWLWRQWRDESGTVLNQALHGIDLAPPGGPTLTVISALDTDIEPAISHATADWARSDRIELAGQSHVGPLLGRGAADCAARVTDWLGFRLAWH